MGKTRCNPLPSAEILRAHLQYEPETGLLRRRIAQRNSPAGATVGCSAPGYVQVGVCGKYYKAHRLIWKMVTGHEPPPVIDHIDGDSLNNKWANLRAASFGQNQQNKRLQKNNKSGVKGVFYDATYKGGPKWRAVIGVDGKYIRLGRFHKLEDAEREISKKRCELHGAFARAA